MKAGGCLLRNHTFPALIRQNPVERGDGVRNGVFYPHDSDGPEQGGGMIHGSTQAQQKSDKLDGGHRDSLRIRGGDGIIRGIIREIQNCGRKSHLIHSVRKEDPGNILANPHKTILVPDFVRIQKILPLISFRNKIQFRIQWIRKIHGTAKINFSLRCLNSDCSAHISPPYFVPTDMVKYIPASL